MPPGMDEDNPLFQFMPPDKRRPDARRGFRFHRQRGRHHPHQRARRGRRAEGDRQAHGPPRVRGPRDRLGCEERRGRAEDRRARPAGHQARRPADTAGRRVGRGHRVAVRPGKHRHRRHRERQGAQPAGRHVRPVHPDRRRGQPGQFRRAALQPARRSGRHQLADLQPLRRLPGPVVRDSDRRRDERRQAVAGAGSRDARQTRRRHPGRGPGAGRVVRSRRAARRARRQRRKRRSGRRRPDSAKAMSSSDSTGSRSIPPDSCRRLSRPRTRARPWPCRCGATAQPAKSKSARPDDRR